MLGPFSNLVVLLGTWTEGGGGGVEDVGATAHVGIGSFSFPPPPPFPSRCSLQPAPRSLTCRHGGR